MRRDGEARRFRYCLRSDGVPCLIHHSMSKTRVPIPRGGSLMASMPDLAFSHCLDRDGIIVSTCNACFATVAGSPLKIALEVAEQEHACDPEILHSWTKLLSEIKAASDHEKPPSGGEERQTDLSHSPLVTSRVSRSEYEDRILKCVECGAEFVFTAGEQMFFHEKQFQNDPKRCKQCKARRSSTNSKVRIETRTMCFECGTETTVPFKPTQGRPVLCRSCFQQQQIKSPVSAKTRGAAC
jgi:CxxC-x17-CxxC domain-containing protein